MDQRKVATHGAIPCIAPMAILLTAGATLYMAMMVTVHIPGGIQPMEAMAQAATPGVTLYIATRNRKA